MNTEVDSINDVEQERRRKVAELDAEDGPEWLKRYEPGSFGCHELLDRASATANLVEQLIREHPACLWRPEWFALADQAVNALCELYQSVGREHLEREVPEPKRRPEIQRDAGGVITNAEELGVEDVVNQQVLCPACGGHVFRKWPSGWDGHSAFQCPGVEGDSSEEKKGYFKGKYRHLFR